MIFLPTRQSATNVLGTLSFALFCACSSGLDGIDATTSSTITNPVVLRSTVIAPSGASGSISAKGLAIRPSSPSKAADVPVDGWSCTVTRVDTGAVLGTGTVSSGTCRVTVSGDMLQIGGNTKLLLEATNGTTTSWRYVELLVSESDTEVCSGTISSASSLAYLSLLREAACDDIRSCSPSFDPEVYFQTQEAIWANVDRDGGGIDDSLSYQFDLFRAAMIGGEHAKGRRPFEFVDQLFKNELSVENIDRFGMIADKIFEDFTFQLESVQNHLSIASQSFTHLNRIANDNFAGRGGLFAEGGTFSVARSIANPLAKQAASSSSNETCEYNNAAAAILAPALEAATPAEAQVLADPACTAFIAKIAESWNDVDGGYQDMSERSQFIAGYVKDLPDGATSCASEMANDAKALFEVFRAIGDSDVVGGTYSENIEKGTAWNRIIDSIGGGDALFSDGKFDESLGSSFNESLLKEDFSLEVINDGWVAEKHYAGDAPLDALVLQIKGLLSQLGQSQTTAQVLANVQTTAKNNGVTATQAANTIRAGLQQLVDQQQQQQQQQTPAKKLMGEACAINADCGTGLSCTALLCRTTQLASLEVAGTWDWAGPIDQTISNTNWAIATSFAIVSYNNTTNVGIIKNDPNNAPNGGEYKKIAWTNIAGISFYYCWDETYHTTAAAAVADNFAPDSSDPGNSGCNGGAWTQLTEPPLFAAPVALTVGDGNRGVVAFDANDDGNLDFAIAGAGLDIVSTMLGDGNGNFTRTNYNVGGTWPTDVVAADINGDNREDLIVAVAGFPALDNPNIGLLTGNADGSFNAVENIPCCTGPGWLIAGDVDNDADNDVIVISYNHDLGEGRLHTLLNNNGTLGAATHWTPFWVHPTGLASGDFNKDGNLDLATVEIQDNDVRVALGGDGQFLLQPILEIDHPDVVGDNYQPSDLTVGDLDEDGNLDLLVAAWDGNSPDFAGGAFVYYGKGDGSFEAIPVVFAVGAGSGGAGGIIVADVNGDNHIDIVTANSLDSSITIWKGAASRTALIGPTTITGLGFSPEQIAAGDFTNDGAIDLVVSDVADSKAYFLRNNN